MKTNFYALLLGKLRPRWVARTPISTFSVRTDWDIPHSELGRFKPFWNGGGIGPSFKTLPPAQRFCQKYAKQVYVQRIEEARRKLLELEEFAGILTWQKEE